MRDRLPAALFLLLVWLAPPARTAEPVRMVILPVVVHRDSVDSGYVSRGIADMLSARFELIGGLEVVRVGEASAATSDAERAREVAAQFGGDYVLYGAFTQFGEGASLDMHCLALRREGADGPPARRVFIQSGTVGEIIPKLDRLVDKVAGFLAERGAIAAVASGAKPAPAAGAGSGPAAGPALAQDAEAAALLRELRDRVEALERAVYPAPAAAPQGTDAAREAPNAGDPNATALEPAPKTGRPPS